MRDWCHPAATADKGAVFPKSRHLPQLVQKDCRQPRDAACRLLNCWYLTAFDQQRGIHTVQTLPQAHPRGRAWELSLLQPAARPPPFFSLGRPGSSARDLKNLWERILALGQLLLVPSQISLSGRARRTEEAAMSPALLADGGDAWWHSEVPCSSPCTPSCAVTTAWQAEMRT